MEEDLTVAYSVTPELRVKLKEPFGLLLRGTSSETIEALGGIVAAEKPPTVVAVGDIVSQNIHEHGVHAQLLVTDGKCMRRSLKPRVFPERRIVHVRNVRGTISAEAVVAMREALESSQRVHLVVDGEEDLLALIAVLYVPLGGLVVYGQPSKGIVVVRVTGEKRAEAVGILKAMEIVRKAK